MLEANFESEVESKFDFELGVKLSMSKFMAELYFQGYSLCL
jgi:hypothetical protein